MKRQLKLFLKVSVLIITIMTVIPNIVFAQEDIYADLNHSATELADVLVDNYGVSAIQYAMISDGKMILSGASGTFGKDTNGTLDNQSLFGIGSISKMFTATAVMMLSDQGKLNLDEPVVAYIPEFKMADERYKNITVRMLLNHSSGIMGSTFMNSFLYDYPNTLAHDSLLPQLAKQRLKADPGEFSVYCNDGFTLAEIVVEKISGMSFSEFIHKNISEPLGMSDTYTPQDDFDRDRLVRTFKNGEETPVDTVNVIGTGGVYSTAEDLCRLGQIYMNDPGYLPAADLLSKTAKRETMQKEYQKGFGPDQSEGLFGYGLGWDSVDAYPYSQYNIQPLIKGGDTQLYHSSMIVLPEHDIVFAAVLSGGSSIFGQIMGHTLILETLLAENEIENIIPPVDIQPPVSATMPVDKTLYAGMYANDMKVHHIDIGEDGILTVSCLSHKEDPDQIYLYTSDDVFVSEDGSRELSFIEESNGKTYICIKKIIDIPGFGQTVMTSYEYEKIEPNVVEDAVQDAWNERTKYYILNENPHGQIWHDSENTYYEITVNEELPGYIAQYKIVDRFKAVQDVRIPGMDGRDLTDIEILHIDDKEYLFLNEMIFVSEKDIVDLNTGENAVCTIQKDGYAEWYSVNANDTGKIMTVDMPENASFAVYDAESCVFFSVVNGNQPVVLPENGKVVFIGTPGTSFSITVNNGEDVGDVLYRQAIKAENEKKLSLAADLYEKALPLLSVTNRESAFECGEALQRITIIKGLYPYTIEDVKAQILAKYPLVTEKKMNRWFENDELEHYFYDGREHYFEDAVTNLMYRYMELMHADTAAQQAYYDLLLKINRLAKEKPEDTRQQYQKPVTYHGTHTISIPRQELPEIGTYRIWLPVPVQSDPQTQVSLDFVTPEKWVKRLPGFDEDIGLLYMEVPMEDLTGDLFIEVKFSFTHYEQRRTVNPLKIGEYDQDSDLYKQYTRSFGNTEITSDIRSKALEIVGAETNPYYAARKIYNYIVNHIDYSFMPHFAMWPRSSQTESDYVHKFTRGDCGAQSMYFTALCRSIGIPARSTGGYQLFSDEFRGHFWAEFYLPDYGWIPADTSAAQIAFYCKDALMEQKQTMIDYFFGNQDSMRCVIQKDTDAALVPNADQMVLLPMAIQIPTVEYSIPSGDIGMTFLEHWTLELEQND